MNQNGRVEEFKIMDNHHTIFVTLPSGSSIAKDNRVTKTSPQMARAQVGKALHREPQERNWDKQDNDNKRKGKDYYLIKAVLHYLKEMHYHLLLVRFI